MKKALFYMVLAVTLLWAWGLFAAEMTSPSFKIPFSSMNGGGNSPMLTDSGGGPGSGNLMMGTSVGQSTPTGSSTSTSFGNGAGFWYQLTSLAPDTDGDGVPDSTDNCVNIANADQTDTDGDSVGDLCDNCTLVPNADQRDTNGDGYGNWCDADLNGDTNTNFTDLAMFKAVFRTADPDADFNGDGNVNFTDLAIFKSMFRAPPGPSAFVIP